MITTIQELVSLKGKTAIVTGGAMGIGFGIASRLAEAGARVLIADISEEKAAEAAATLITAGWSAAACRADVSSEADIVAMIATASEKFGGVDILVNNAGIYPFSPVLDMSPEIFDKVLSVNLRSVFLATKHASEQMIKQGRGGKIINITSIDALHPSSIGLAHYDASKHGVWGFTKNVALELAPHNIQINAIAPGAIATPGAAAAQGGAAAVDAFSARIPMGRMGEPDDIGRVALFLASELSSYMTGSQVVVDGGMLLK